MKPTRPGRRGGHHRPSDRLQGHVAADELDQLAQITLISADPIILLVRGDGPHTTLKQFVEAAKTKPGTIN